MIKVLTLLICSLALFAQSVNNGTAALIVMNKQSPDTVITYNKLILPTYNHPLKKEKQFILVPVNYYTKEMTQTIYFNDVNTSKTYQFNVSQGAYGTEKLDVDPAKIKPPKSEQRRIGQEYRRARAVFSKVSPSQLWTKPFIYPLQSEVTSPFGTARMYNGVLKRYHTGTDFRAKTPTPVVATNDGNVVLVQSRYFAGNTVIIDHGKGLYSCYYHLSEFHVREGEKVLRGEVIGLSGQSGRVTGPHLHFSVVLHDVKVDPLNLIDKLNYLFR